MGGPVSPLNHDCSSSGGGGGVCGIRFDAIRRSNSTARGRAAFTESEAARHC